MKLAYWQDRVGKVIRDNVGRVLVDFGDARPQWLIKGAPDLILIERQSRGRPPKFATNADRQRAYRERKSGKALRKYTKKREG
jgi:hypothetical protein